MILEHETWHPLNSIPYPSSTTIDVLALHPNNTHLATVDRSATDCQLAVWDLRNKSIVNKYSSKARIMAFAWTGAGKDAVFVDSEGNMGLWKSPVAASGLTKVAARAEAEPAIPAALKSLFDEEVMESKPKEKKVKGLESDSDDESMTDAEANDASAVVSDEEGVGDGFVVDDDGAGYADYGIDVPLKKGKGVGFRRSLSAGLDDFGAGMMMGAAQLHRSFMPNATPQKPGKTTRYLCGLQERKAWRSPGGQLTFGFLAISFQHDRPNLYH